MLKDAIRILSVLILMFAVLQFAVPAKSRYYVPEDPGCANGFRYIDHYESTCVWLPDIPLGYPVAVNSREAPLIGVLIAFSIDLAPIFLLLALLFYLKSLPKGEPHHPIK